MKARPILFTPENAQKVHVGTKTQTRRIITDMNPALAAANPTAMQIMHALQCPYGTVGDRMWCREAYCYGSPALPSGRGIIPYTGMLPSKCGPNMKLVYRGDWNGPDQPPWRSSIHMPKWACRTWLEITDVRAERLWAISYDDEGAEGITPGPYCNDRHSGFVALWESINGKGSWERNDWVWVIAYRKVEL